MQFAMDLENAEPLSLRSLLSVQARTFVASLASQLRSCALAGSAPERSTPLRAPTLISPLATRSAACTLRPL